MPIPEGHVVRLALRIIVHLLAPLRVFSRVWMGHVIGWPITITGLALAGRAVWVVHDMDMETPTQVMVMGPYRYGRNPMYVGWTLICLGVSLVVNSAWPIGLLPLVLIHTHFLAVRKEDHELERRFASEYRLYRDRVRRYL